MSQNLFPNVHILPRVADPSTTGILHSRFRAHTSWNEDFFYTAVTKNNRPKTRKFSKCSVSWAWNDARCHLRRPQTQKVQAVSKYRCLGNCVDQLASAHWISQCDIRGTPRTVRTVPTLQLAPAPTQYIHRAKSHFRERMFGVSTCSSDRSLCSEVRKTAREVEGSVERRREGWTQGPALWVLVSFYSYNYHVSRSWSSSKL